VWWGRIFSVLQCVAVCCSVLQCVAVCCSVLQCVAVCCTECCIFKRLTILWFVTRECSENTHSQCCSVLQCVALCCSVLHNVLYFQETDNITIRGPKSLVRTYLFVVCCGVLQYFAVCCSVLQCVAVSCRVLQCALHFQQASNMGWLWLVGSFKI